MARIPGLVTTDHTFTVPLDHRDPSGRTIEIFAREVASSAPPPAELGWLLFLQGGPGGKAPRPLGPDGWIGRAVEKYRVLLLDQRGTGRSTPITAEQAAGFDSDAELAAYLRASPRSGSDTWGWPSAWATASNGCTGCWTRPGIAVDWPAVSATK